MSVDGRRVVAIVQARMSSQRLPGKVLRPLPTPRTAGAVGTVSDGAVSDGAVSDGAASGEPVSHWTVLDWTVARVRRAELVDEVVVATSQEPSDDVLAEHCAARGIRCVRGSLDDVLDRFHAAAQQAAADIVVRVTADCPLIDAAVLDLVVGEHVASGSEFTANRLPPPARRTWPIGLDVEVADAAVLERAWREASSQRDREHVMPYLYDPPGRFRVTVVEAPSATPVAAGSVRWTVDTPADLEAVRGLIVAAEADLSASWQRLLEVWGERPDLAALNAAVEQRSVGHVDPRAGGHRK